MPILAVGCVETCCSAAHGESLDGKGLKMRVFAFIAVVLAACGVTGQQTLAAQSGGQRETTTKSSQPTRAPIEEKTKQIKDKKLVPPTGCGPTMPGKPGTSTC